MELSFVLEPLIATKAKERQGQRNDLNIRENSHECSEKGRTDESLAQIAGISSNTIRRAKVIKEHGTPEQIERAGVDGCENLTAQFCAVTCSTEKWCRSVQIWMDRRNFTPVKNDGRLINLSSEVS